MTSIYIPPLTSSGPQVKRSDVERFIREVETEASITPALSVAYYVGSALEGDGFEPDARELLRAYGLKRFEEGAQKPNVLNRVIGWVDTTLGTSIRDADRDGVSDFKRPPFNLGN